MDPIYVNPHSNCETPNERPKNSGMSETVVISGMAGQFPESDNIYQLRDNLFNQIDMVTDANPRWPPVRPKVIQRTGKIRNVSKFDAGFFGVQRRHANSLNPMARLILERTFEAIVDAGYNPSDLKGSATGVFIGVFIGETENTIRHQKTISNGHCISGFMRSMMANRISYSFGFQGPSMAMDASCCSSLTALEHAYRSIRNGTCDRAIVAGTGLLLNPMSSLQFHRLGILSPTGSCKAFDDRADGFVRSEAICVLLLQKSEGARRIYAHVVNARNNCDGFTPLGVMHPSVEMQSVLLRETYMECGVDPKSVGYVEAHGTKVGDPVEMNSIYAVMGKGRKEPLCVGSLKSNMGHSEPASGICSIVKVVLAMETGYIPPNYDFVAPNQKVKVLKEERLKVVAKKTPWPNRNGLAGVNSFGFGGTNNHVVLRWNGKSRSSIEAALKRDLPRLVCVSGRTRSAVDTILDDLTSRPLDVEFVTLLHTIFGKKITGHAQRGYAIIGTNGVLRRSIGKSQKVSSRRIIWMPDNNETVWWELGQKLKALPSFASFPFLMRLCCNGSFEMANAEMIRSSVIKILKVIGLSPRRITTRKFYEKNSTDFNSILVAIGSKWKRFPGNDVLALIEEDSKDPLLDFLSCLGRLFEDGYDLQLDKFYPEIAFPVSRSTPMVSPLIEWAHRDNWFVSRYKFEDEIKNGVRVVRVAVKEDEWNFLAGHNVDGRNIFPATGYLYLAWDTLAKMEGKEASDMRVVFEDVRFLRATKLPKEDAVTFKISLQMGVGKFEITEGDTIVVTGKMRNLDESNSHLTDCTSDNEKNGLVLQQKDIYKELNLRGYNYRGLFRGLQEFDAEVGRGLVEWKKNWIAFMDNMLQLFVFQLDNITVVPIHLHLVIVDCPKHLKELEENVDHRLAVYACKQTGVFRSGGIEIRGLNVGSMSRRKTLRPVLETYEFVPNEITGLSLEQSVRVFVQLVIENSSSSKLKIIESPDSREINSPSVFPLVQQAVADIPLIQVELSDEASQLPCKKSSSATVVVVVLNAFRSDEVLRNSVEAAGSTGGFIISREDATFDVANARRDSLRIICVHRCELETLLLLRPAKSTAKRLKLIDVDETLSWLPLAQDALKTDHRLILYSQNRTSSGIVGLVKSLRKEPNSSDVSVFVVEDGVPKFDADRVFYSEQFEKKLSVNVWKKGKWGTYRHLVMQEIRPVRSEHCYVNVTISGDLSSVKWLQGPLKRDDIVKEGRQLIHVYFCAFNFRDVMSAAGKLSAKNLPEQGCIPGSDFSGRDSSGKRVMGVTTSGAFSTLIMAESFSTWPIPTSWSLEDAATVPKVYLTVIYALLVKANLRPGQTVLIHSATGGVGQAAINIALHFDCVVFATVGCDDKKRYLLRNYPQISEQCVGDSRNTSFEQMVLAQTGGRGVDVVLNSLTEEKLLASVRCLAEDGNFLEIGKFDLTLNNELRLKMLAKRATFHGIALDLDLERIVKGEVMNNFLRLIEDGVVKPLPRTVFCKSEVSKAYKYMATGRHVGKVLIKIRTEEKEMVRKVPRMDFSGMPRFYCGPQYSYLILGGLGGFGLQLANWLVIRGARKLVLSSRNGITEAYQTRMINTWKSQGTEIAIRNDDVTTEQGCLDLINFASSLGSVRGVFNLAAVLRDALFENQTAESYGACLGPKATAVRYLDAITKRLCPNLKYFVVFSSAVCGRGSGGQTNYAMANSIMEGVCERRKSDGLPALAIQWGAIGDVGIVAEQQNAYSDRAILGTFPQRISSCINVLDDLLAQDGPIVSSIVVAEKCRIRSNNVVDCAIEILGLRHVDKIDLQSTFPELGMDSMSTNEIKQALERDYDVFLSPQELRLMTFAKFRLLTAPKTDKSYSKTDDSKH